MEESDVELDSLGRLAAVDRAVLLGPAIAPDASQRSVPARISWTADRGQCRPGRGCARRGWPVLRVLLAPSPVTALRHCTRASQSEASWWSRVAMDCSPRWHGAESGWPHRACRTAPTLQSRLGENTGLVGPAACRPVDGPSRRCYRRHMRRARSSWSEWLPADSPSHLMPGQSCQAIGRVACDCSGLGAHPPSNR